MNLQQLKFLAKAEVDVQISSGTDENGSLKIVDTFGCKARVEQHNKVIYLKDGQKATLLMKVFIFENLEKFPDNISGYCTAFNYKYDIANGSKKRNQDGSVNHIVLELVK